ncbi:MAG: hypothetical protein COS89_02150, partial [Deltaproteobacteria bacterium CG07_land_8_20_14_0_80_38_7]
PDIAFGFMHAKAIAGLDIGQTIVVQDQAVLAVEAIEGTDEAIARGGSLGSGKAAVIKVAKPAQDLRFDVPAVGPDTLETMHANGFAGLDIGQTIVVQDQAVLAVEAIEGTDEAIARGGSLGSGKAAVIKVAKPAQDLRFDVPAVGPDTLETMHANGCTLLAVEAGKTLIIDHGNNIETLYAHCSKLYVKKGDRVDKGMLIANVGSTGRSTGPHLHYEVRIDGFPVDPMYFVNSELPTKFD